MGPRNERPTNRFHTTQAGLVIAAYGRRGILETDAGEELKYLVKGQRFRVVCGTRR